MKIGNNTSNAPGSNNVCEFNCQLPYHYRQHLINALPFKRVSNEYNRCCFIFIDIDIDIDFTLNEHNDYAFVSL